MKSFAVAVVLLCAFAQASGADAPWQFGRIVDVKKSVSTTTKTWVVNTPIEEESTHVVVSVQAYETILTGAYEISATRPEPPVDWVRDFPVAVQVAGDSVYVRSASGSVHLHITQRKTAPAMKPLAAEEKKRLETLDSGPEESLIGFSRREEKSAPVAAEATPQPAPAPLPTTGMVTVRSTPFLSEVFVDGDSMGYTPAKVALGPGKHSFRVEKNGYKPWLKQLTVTVGSELTLDATLEKK